MNQQIVQNDGDVNRDSATNRIMVTERKDLISPYAAFRFIERNQ